MLKHTQRSVLLMVLCICMMVLPGGIFAQEQDTDDVIAAVIAATSPQLIQEIVSPDDAYIATVIVFPCTDIGMADGSQMSYERLDITNADTQEVTTVAEQLINCGGLGTYGLSMTYWTENTTYLYYTDAREGAPDGGAGMVQWSPLQRVNLTTMTVERSGQAILSHNNRWLVMWTQEQISILPADAALNTRTDFALLPETLQIVDVFWLPDNRGVVYLQADVPYNSTRSAMTYIDIETMEQVLLLDSNE